MLTWWHALQQLGKQAIQNEQAIVHPWSETWLWKAMRPLAVMKGRRDSFALKKDFIAKELGNASAKLSNDGLRSSKHLSKSRCGTYIIAAEIVKGLAVGHQPNSKSRRPRGTGLACLLSDLGCFCWSSVVRSRAGNSAEMSTPQRGAEMNYFRSIFWRETRPEAKGVSGIAPPLISQCLSVDSIRTGLFYQFIVQAQDQKCGRPLSDKKRLVLFV